MKRRGVVRRPLVANWVCERVVRIEIYSLTNGAQQETGIKYNYDKL
jgi:hypothetical protein